MRDTRPTPSGLRASSVPVRTLLRTGRMLEGLSASTTSANFADEYFMFTFHVVQCIR